MYHPSWSDSLPEDMLRHLHNDFTIFFNNDPAFSSEMV